MASALKPSELDPGLCVVTVVTSEPLPLTPFFCGEMVFSVISLLGSYHIATIRNQYINTLVNIHCCYKLDVIYQTALTLQLLTSSSTIIITTTTKPTSDITNYLHAF